MVIYISLLKIITLNQEKQINKKEHYCTRKAHVRREEGVCIYGTSGVPNNYPVY